MSDNDLRTRLADALREHPHMSRWRICGCSNGRPSPPICDLPDHASHLADVLLSLPGIAIVDTAEVTTEWRYRIGITKVNCPEEDWARHHLAESKGDGCVESRTVIETPWTEV